MDALEKLIADFTEKLVSLVRDATEVSTEDSTEDVVEDVVEDSTEDVVEDVAEDSTEDVVEDVAEVSTDASDAIISALSEKVAALEQTIAQLIANGAIISEPDITVEADDEDEWLDIDELDFSMKEKR